jgi:hypothetical protein
MTLPGRNDHGRGGTLTRARAPRVAPDGAGDHVGWRGFCGTRGDVTGKSAGFAPAVGTMENPNAYRAGVETAQQDTP